MAPTAGLRKGSGDSPLPDGAENGLKHGSPRKPSAGKPRTAFARERVIGYLTLITIVLLLIRMGVSIAILDPAWQRNIESSFGPSMLASSMVSWTTFQRFRPASALAESVDFAASAANASAQPGRPRRARVLARAAQRLLGESSTCAPGLPLKLLKLSRAYHSPSTFFQDFQAMDCKFKIFIYPHSGKGHFAHVFRPYSKAPTGNYASEHYFKMALKNSNFVTQDPSEADLFFMPFSIARMRNDPYIGADGIKNFVRDYVANISTEYPYWNRSSGADHFYVNCHSIGKTATDLAYHVRISAIQVVCSSSYYLQSYFPHKDATIPQVWPRSGTPKNASSIQHRITMAFFAGAGNSPVRAKVIKHWSNDSEIKVYGHRIKTPYEEALLSSKYCLHVRGYEVNTARMADALHFGCVPIVIANYHDLPFNDVLDWRQFSLVVAIEDIPKLKDIITAVSQEKYVEMQKNVMQVRQHFEWHPKPVHFDAFYMVMYELWLRRHVIRSDF